MRGAEFFRLLAVSGSNTPLFDEHSLDAQRYYNVLCLVYGSNPERLSAMVGRDKLPAERARRCPSEYTKIYTAWESLLQSSQAGGQRQSQPGWQQPAAPARDYDEDDYAEEPSRSERAPSRTRDGSSGGTGSRGSSGWWLCTAEGSIGTAYEDGPWEYSTETAHGSAPSRDEAYLKAIEDCNALMSMSSWFASSAGKKRDVGTCSVVNCIGQ